jgi:hypothetical protein
MVHDFLTIIQKVHEEEENKLHKKTIKKIQNRILELWGKFQEAQPHITGFIMGMGMWSYRGEVLEFYGEDCADRVIFPDEDYSDFKHDDTFNFEEGTFNKDTVAGSVPYYNDATEEVRILLDYILLELNYNLEFDGKKFSLA